MLAEADERLAANQAHAQPGLGAIVVARPRHRRAQLADLNPLGIKPFEQARLLGRQFSPPVQLLHRAAAAAGEQRTGRRMPRRAGREDRIGFAPPLAPLAAQQAHPHPLAGQGVLDPNPPRIHLAQPAAIPVDAGDPRFDELRQTPRHTAKPSESAAVEPAAHQRRGAEVVGEQGAEHSLGEPAGFRILEATRLDGR